MKEGWTYKTIEDACSINYGTRVVQKKDKGSTYYVYGGGGATFMIDRYNREDCFIVSRFAMSPKCTRYVEGKFFLNDSGLSVSTNDEGFLCQKFLDKVLLANNDNIYAMGKGMAQRNLDMPSFRKLIIPIPPIEEQERIVAELDLLQGIIEKKKEQLKAYDQLAQSIFYTMFGDPIDNPKGWETKQLGKVCKTTSGGTPSKNHTEYYDGGTIPWLRSGEVSQGFIYNTELFITEEGLKCSSAKMIPIDTVVIAMYGATVGQVGIIKSPMCTNQAICSILPNDIFIPIYLYYFLLSKKSDYLKVAVGGAQPNISQGIIKETVIGIPPLSLQQEFAEKVEAIERQKALVQQSIDETQTMFDYTMDKYFG